MFFSNDVILQKQSKDRFGLDGDEESTMLEESVSPKKSVQIYCSLIYPQCSAFRQQLSCRNCNCIVITHLQKKSCFHLYSAVVSNDVGREAAVLIIRRWRRVFYRWFRRRWGQESQIIIFIHKKRAFSSSSSAGLHHHLLRYKERYK